MKEMDESQRKPLTMTIIINIIDSDQLPLEKEKKREVKAKRELS
jgi:hypothetical protein